MYGLTEEEVRHVTAGPKRLATAFAILRYIESKGGATCDECAEALGLDHQLSSPRFSELEAAKCIVPTGKRRKTRKGAYARVCVVSKSCKFKTYVKSIVKYQSMKKRKESLLKVVHEFLAVWPPRSTEDQSKAIKQLVLGLTTP